MKTKGLLFLASVILAAGCGSRSPIQQVDAAGTTTPGWAVRSDTHHTLEMAVPPGTAIHVRLAETLDTGRNRAGDHFSATLDTPVTVNEKVVIPKGTVFHGHLTTSAPSGRLQGRAYLSLTLDSFEMNGSTYAISTSSAGRASEGHKKRNWLMVGGGSGFGAAVGALAGGGSGALIGAGAGAAAGTATAALTGKKNVRLPAETPLRFSLRDEVKVPVRG